MKEITNFNLQISAATAWNICHRNLARLKSDKKIIPRNKSKKNKKRVDRQG
jgi:hypothetical protein